MKKINVEVTRKQTRRLKEPFVITVPSNPEVMILLTHAELDELAEEIQAARVAYAKAMLP